MRSPTPATEVARPPLQGRRREALLLPSATLASALVVFGGLAWKSELEARSRFDVEARWEALTSRPFEGRLAGLDSFKPFKPTPPAPPPPLVAELGTPHRGPQATQAASRPLLELLEGRGCPSAVSKLEALTQSDAGAQNWSHWSNLAAAHLACVPSEPDKAGQALEHRLEAIEASTKALELEPNASEAAFNRALALAALPLPGQARLAWDRYLELDHQSEWAEEARRRREAPPPAPNLPPSLTAKRYRAERELLPAWTQALVAGDEPAAHRAASDLEALLAELGPQGDVIAAAVGAVREAEAAGDKKRLELLAAGHRGFAEGVALHRAEHATKAVLRLSEAASLLERAGSPFALRAKLRQLWASEKPKEPELRALIEQLDQGGFTLQAAEGWRLLAMRLGLAGRLARALEWYEEAQRRYRNLGVWEEAAAAAGMTAEHLAILGRHAEVPSFAAAALTAAPSMDDPWYRYSVYWNIAAALRPAAPSAAAELLREAATSCEAMQERPLCGVDTRIALARLLTSATAARAELVAAHRSLDLAADSDGKERTRIDLRRAEATWLLTHTEPSDIASNELALEISSEIVVGYESLGLPLSASRARVLKADALARLGRAEEERAELAAALSHLRSWDRARRLEATAAEAPSPTELRELFERLISREPSAIEGLLLAEEMHDRLAPRLSTDYQPPALDELSALVTRVPPGTALVEYALLAGRGEDDPEQLVIWTVAPGVFQLQRLTPEGPFGQVLERLRNATSRQDLDTWQAASGELFRSLAEPVLAHMPTGTRHLVLIPDREIHGVPFRGLVNPETGRFLDEDFTVSLAVSAREVLRRKTPDQGGGRTGREVVSLGFESFRALGLEDLRRAPEEARAIREIYGEADASACTASDWPSLRACLPNARIIHLATHAHASPRRAGWSWLAMPEETIDLPRLWDELPDLSRAELVVLSACETVAGSGSGEGLGGLARPFLAKGARTVVGTLWRINDEPASVLFPAFHRAFRDGGDAAQALREAREALPAWREKPWDWAGVGVVKQ